MYTVNNQCSVLEYTWPRCGVGKERKGGGRGGEREYKNTHASSSLHTPCFTHLCTHMSLCLLLQALSSSLLGFLIVFLLLLFRLLSALPCILFWCLFINCTCVYLMCIHFFECTSMCMQRYTHVFTCVYYMRVHCVKYTLT